MTILLTLFPLLSVAAPIPFTSSSHFTSSKRGLYFSDLGFSMNAADTGWIQSKKFKENAFIEMVYKPSEDENVQAALTVRHDLLKEQIDIAQYANKWVKDYQRFGFDVLTSKKVKVASEIGFLLDLVHQDTAKQLRQVLFTKNDKVVSLTCRDDTKSFSKTLVACNEIIRTFKW